jgi:hypothetical protein
MNVRLPTRDDLASQNHDGSGSDAAILNRCEQENAEFVGASSQRHPSPTAARTTTAAIMWRIYDTCSLTLAKYLATVKQNPGNLNVPSTRKLRPSLESLFLWGDSFQPSDLDSIADWSYDLGDAIMQVLIDLSLLMIQGKFGLKIS